MQGASPRSIDRSAHATPGTRTAFLAADVGGTHARIGLVRATADPADGHPRLSISQYRKFVCADYANLHDILREYTHCVGGVAATQACIACAGLLLDDHLVNANLPWPVSLARLRDELGFESVAIVNDFTAVAYAAHFQEIAESTRIAGNDAIDPRQPRLVVGAGTGLGAAALIPGGTRPTILATEAGHAALAARTQLELEILRRLAGDAAHVPNERIFSGPGLLALYRTLCALRAAHAQFESPAQVTSAALAGSDALAAEAVEVFCAWFGSLIGDLVMMLGAYGGVYLAGGVLPQIAPLLRASGFAARLGDKGPLREALERVPVHLIEHGQLGVAGAAHWFLDHEYEERKSD
ncbi:MAG: glucokinase [Rudaea sp.]|uniref:glucokinase n=1 Tax=Rudaea sp. TaxID=2136325 RepID=UPI0039E4CEDC